MVSCLHDMIVQWLHNLVGIINQHLIGLKVHFTRWNPYPMLLEWSRTWDWIAHRPRGKSNSTVTLKWFLMTYFVRSSSEKLRLQMGTNTETHNWTVCREWVTLEHLVWNRMSPSNPSFQVSGSPAEEEAETVNGRGWGGHQGNQTF